MLTLPGFWVRLLGVEDDVEEEQAGGGEDDVVAEEHFDPEGGVAVAGEDGGDSLDHGQQRGNEDGKKDERQEKLAVAAADGERGEEGSVGHERPGTERKNQQQLPCVAEDVEVVHDHEDGREDDLHDGDEEKVGQHLGEKHVGAGDGSHALRVENLVADFARPGLIEGADRGEHGGHAEHAAGNVAGKGAAGIEGQREEDDHEQREEEHGVDGFFGAPLDTQILDEMSEEGAGHWEPSGVVSLTSFVRSAVWTGGPRAAAARR